MKRIEINIDAHLEKIKNDKDKMISPQRKSFHDQGISIIYLQSIDQYFPDDDLEALKKALPEIENKFYSMLDFGTIDFNKMGIANDDYYYIVGLLRDHYEGFDEKSLGRGLVITRS